METTTHAANATSISLSNFSGSGTGLDAIMAIQLLMMKDCDEQLKSLGQEIKITKVLKTAYRKEIQTLQSLLLSPHVNKKGDVPKKDDKAEYIKVSPDIFNTTGNAKNNNLNYGLKNGVSYNYDEKTGTVNATETGEYGEITGNPIYDKNDRKHRVIIGYTVRKEDVEKRMEMLNGEKDNLNDQSTEFSLQVQNITNIRKTALETVTNVMSKQNEGLSTIIRNYRS
ncbi:MAG: hypothetical protein ACD_73C00690G0004 [uncultured bacterium]|nr:MAG: hypothetical protein ACD_73C00690G0004 [uncultured bacterium]